MSYYSPYPGFYAYPMTYTGQEFYPVYPPGGQMDNSGTIFYQDAPGDSLPNGSSKLLDKKVGFNNRKESHDSGISDSPSRKISTASTISNACSSILEDFDEAETPFVAPDDEQCQQISQQVEFYFSDANISKDKFLLKHVKRNKEGFVSLKLISSFKRVKHLTKDWRQVGFAIEKCSKRLEVNDLKTKVRRIDALPDHDETAHSRTVLALNLPMERPTIESVAEIFSVCGEVALIRILRPGNPLPTDVRSFLNKVPDLTSKVCALIEFERTEFALKARRLFNSEKPDVLKVIELVPQKNNKKNEDRKKSGQMKMQQQQNMQQNMQQNQQRRYNQQMSMNTPIQANAVPRRKVGVFGSPKFSPITEEQGRSMDCLNPNAPAFNSLQQRKNSRSSSSMSQGSGGSSPGANDNSSISAWMTRRISGQLDIARSGLSLPPNVIRQPRGPEEGQGFQRWAKNRMDTATKKIENDNQAQDEMEEKEKQDKEMSDALSNLNVAPLIVNVSDETSGSEDEDCKSEKIR